MDSAKVLIPCSRFTPATILPALLTTSTTRVAEPRIKRIIIISTGCHIFIAPMNSRLFGKYALALCLCAAVYVLAAAVDFRGVVHIVGGGDVTGEDVQVDSVVT